MASGFKPVLGITMGDVCGIGPEVIAKALCHPKVYEMCSPIVIGDRRVLEANFKYGSGSLSARKVDSPTEGKFQPGTVDVWDPLDTDLIHLEQGTVCEKAGNAAAEWVMAAIELAMDGTIDGIVTAPLNKEAMNLAGHSYPGHTELLAEKTGSSGVRLMLASEQLNVVHVTGHVSLADVPLILTRDRVDETIALFHAALVSLGKRNPRIAVCGLNPHAGESGLFGEEDREVILPAVQKAAERGWEVQGPFPADTVFGKAYRGDYDGIVAMYHDQGHAPVKLVAFDDAVNVTLGLRIVRTSVDHGTAFDIAGKGVANEANMVEAIRLAARLAGQRRE